MTVYLHCEGVTDYAVIPLLIKKAGKKSNLEIQWVKRNELKEVKTHRKSDIVISGHYKKIKALAVIAMRNGSNHIAYHQDADGRYIDVLRAIKSEFDELSGFCCLAVVPKEMIESWLLSDENAYPLAPDDPALPPNPEELWGQKSDPDSNHPYNYFVRVLTQFRLADNRDTYAEIAENTGIEVLKRRCPESFGQFYTDMQSFITPEAGP
jgi:hypothetical protein